MYQYYFTRNTSMKLPRSSNVRWESRQARSKLVEAGIAPKKRHGFSLAPYGSSALVTVRFDTAEITERSPIPTSIPTSISLTDLTDARIMSVEFSRYIITSSHLERILFPWYGTFLIQVSFSSVVFSTFPVTQRAPLYIASETWQPLLLAAAKASTSIGISSKVFHYVSPQTSCQGLEERVWTEVEPLDSDPESWVVDAANEILLKLVIISRSIKNNK